MMLMSWLISDSKTSPWGEYKDNSNYLLKVAAHTLITKSLLYGSAVLFSTVFLLLFFCSTVAWLAIQAVWFVCCIEADELKLSTEACDSLESELVHQDMKRAVDVQGNWMTVAVKTSSGLECTMRLHSIICVSGSDKMHSSSSCRNDANAAKVNRMESSHNAYDPPIKKKLPNTQGAVSGKRTNMEEKVKEDVKPSKPVLFWLHGAGGSAILSFGISGIIDRLVDDYDIYALDLPGFGRSTIEWPGKDSLNNATGDDAMGHLALLCSLFAVVRCLPTLHSAVHSLLSCLFFISALYCFCFLIVVCP
jgi:hypothetical protein